MAAQWAANQRDSLTQVCLSVTLQVRWVFDLLLEQDQRLCHPGYSLFTGC